MFSWQVRKGCGNRRCCSLQAISPFPLSFQKTCTADTYCWWRMIANNMCMNLAYSVWKFCIHDCADTDAENYCGQSWSRSEMSSNTIHSPIRIIPPFKKEVMFGIILSNLILVICRRIVIITSLHSSVLYSGTKVTWKIYFILRAHAVANTCARNN